MTRQYNLRAPKIIHSFNGNFNQNGATVYISDQDISEEKYRLIYNFYNIFFTLQAAVQKKS